VELANAMAPSDVARVLLLSIVKHTGESGENTTQRLEDAQEVMRKALSSSFAAGHSPEALITLQNSE
jgi:hypothetical protein